MPMNVDEAGLRQSDGVAREGGAVVRDMMRLRAMMLVTASFCCRHCVEFDVAVVEG